MKTLTKRLLFVGLVAGMAGSASAGTQTGHVVKLHVRASDGLVYVELDGTASDKPACASSHSYWMIKNETSITGKQQLAQLLAAQVSGKQITIFGANTCTRWIDGEDIDEIMLLQTP